MKIPLIVSAVTGLAWSLLSVILMGGSAGDWVRVSFIAAGIAAGIIAGLQTISSRERRSGKEGLWPGLACYYLAVIAFWASWILVERISMCIEYRGWTDFDLSDHINMLMLYLIYGTIPPWSLLLIPLCFANRWLVWKTYHRNEKTA
jgi:hypothetical protein